MRIIFFAGKGGVGKTSMEIIGGRIRFFRDNTNSLRYA
jgi:CO dehydrogenase nickel-insertion accessory protein CooC1